jgi:outer membrane protein
VGQRRLEADSIRDQVRAAVISSWGQLEAARAQIAAAQSQVEAAETALNGVREEARVGQRTTLDVLNAQQELLNARVNLITAQRDRVVASYAVVQATGRLNSRNLGLAVAHYSAKTHFDQVKDTWGGLTTPDGR